jgi:hypothetical protein
MKATTRRASGLFTAGVLTLFITAFSTLDSTPAEAGGWECAGAITGTLAVGVDAAIDPPGAVVAVFHGAAAATGFGLMIKACQDHHLDALMAVYRAGIRGEMITTTPIRCTVERGCRHINPSPWYINQ